VPSKVVIYVTGYCPFCHAAKAFLRSKKVDFQEIDVSGDDKLRAKLVAMSGQETVPQIFADGKSIGGYEDLVRYYASGKTL
jgi:glutaredoxin 3